MYKFVKSWRIVLFILVLFAGWFSIYAFQTTKYFSENNNPSVGATFTKSFAEHLQLDWRKVYLGALDDLKIKKFRIGLNWNEIEPSPGKFNFSDFDWMLSEAEKRNAKIVLAIGRRLPRWPECRVPEWAEKLPESELEARILKMLEASVSHFKASQTISTWQVENEPFFRFFGKDCPKPNKKFLAQEILLVRSLDKDRPVMITDSGELSLWWNSAALNPDILGISIYRYTWNKYFGFLKYFLPSWSYNIKGRLVSRFVSRIIISELQAEPWAPNGFLNLTSEEEAKTMSPAIFKDTFEFARKSGYDEAYLWGLEWWYFKKEKGDPVYWNFVKDLNLLPTANIVY